LLIENKSNLRLITGANSNYAEWLDVLLGSIKLHNYEFQIYDLGGLGMGLPLTIKNDIPSLDSKGVYVRVDDKWNSKALHKPDLLIHDIEEQLKLKSNSLVVYLDADTVILDSLDGLEGDYDFGVTVRDESELLANAASGVDEFTGHVNAGVLFLRSNEKALKFLHKWRDLTLKKSNDQRALNELINPNRTRLVPGEIICCEDLKIKTFDGNEFNYTFRRNQNIPSKVKVLHFKSNLDRLNLFIQEHKMFHPIFNKRLSYMVEEIIGMFPPSDCKNLKRVQNDYLRINAMTLKRQKKNIISEKYNNLNEAELIKVINANENNLLVLKGKYDRLRFEYDQTRENYKSVRSSLSAVRKELKFVREREAIKFDALKEKFVKKCVEFDQRCIELDQIRNNYKSVRSSLSGARQELKDIRGSRVWRWTATLRKLLDLIF
jgi:hypothetical protein